MLWIALIGKYLIAQVFLLTHIITGGGKPLPGKVRHFHVQGMADLALYDRHVRGGRGPGRGSGALAVEKD